jgi:Ca2+-binding RTX toxin-like protein
MSWELIGTDASETLVGGSGSELLQGLGGDDMLNGREGSDTLVGGAGSDSLFGGDGADTFVFGTAFGADNIDTVIDFVSGQDKLSLANGSGSPFEMLAEGMLNPAALDITNDGNASTADTRVVYDPATGALYYDADGTGAGEAMQFATLANKPAAIMASDIIVGS